MTNAIKLRETMAGLCIGRDLELLEPCEGKLSCTVLRGESGSNTADLLDDWLGDEFFFEADKLKAKNETLYKHEYVGEVTGTGGAVFENVEDRELTDETVANFDRLYFGLLR